MPMHRAPFTRPYFVSGASYAIRVSTDGDFCVRWIRAGSIADCGSSASCDRGRRARTTNDGRTRDSAATGPWAYATRAEPGYSVRTQSTRGPFPARRAGGSDIGEAVEPQDSQSSEEGLRARRETIEVPQEF